MSQFALAALAFIAIPTGAFFLLGSTILYHLRKYGLEGDSTKKAAMLFSAVLIFISLFIILVFFSIDWNSVNVNDFIEKSNINIYPLDYE